MGFALSVTATLGIVLLYRPLEQAFLGRRRQGLAFALWKPAAVSLAATAAALLGTFPCLLYTSWACWICSVCRWPPCGIPPGP